MASDDDPREEFRRAVADVAPLRHARRVTPRAPAAAPVPVQRHRDELAVLEESLGPMSLEDAIDTGEELAYLREGLDRRILRRLRRGDYVIQGSLDLHGLNRVQAAESVAVFLKECRERDARCVRIVHGKGLGSPGREPVLKAKLRQWLPRREEVLAFCQAPASEGGGGAALVLLKANLRSKR